MPFTFLAELQQKFTSYPSASSSSMSDSPAYSLQGSFGPVIAQLMTQYNTNPPTDELTRAQTELAQVKDIMVQNVEQILSRGERIELLVDKTDTMASQATAFRRGARTVRRSMWWKNTRILALSIVVGLVRLLIIVSWNCARGLSSISGSLGASLGVRSPVLRGWPEPVWGEVARLTRDILNRRSLPFVVYIAASYPPPLSTSVLLSVPFPTPPVSMLYASLFFHSSQITPRVFYVVYRSQSISSANPISIRWWSQAPQRRGRTLSGYRKGYPSLRL